MGSRFRAHGERRRKGVQARPVCREERRARCAGRRPIKGAATRDSSEEVARGSSMTRESTARRNLRRHERLRLPLTGARGAQSRSAISFGKLGGRTKTRQVTVADSHRTSRQRGIRQTFGQTTSLWWELDPRRRKQRHSVYDEIGQDLRARRPCRRRCLARGVQARDLGALIEGTTVSPRRVAVKTDQHPVNRIGRLPIAKHSSLLPELQAAGGPIRVELRRDRDDMRRS